MGCSRRQKQGAKKALKPMMWLDTRRRLDAVKWNTGDENWAGSVSGCDREVHLYDLEYCMVRKTLRIAS